jgi:Sec-independent protein secretion pathway component TatC
MLAIGYVVAFPTALQFLMEMAKQGHMVPLIAAEKYFDTPTRDIAKMIVAIPMVLLHLIGVIVAFVFGRQRQSPDA